MRALFEHCLHHSTRFAVAALPLLAAMAPVARAGDAAAASDNWRTTILEENDSLYTHTDKHYTQGIRFSALSPPIGTGNWANGLYGWEDVLPSVFALGGTRRAAVFLGQSIFTPVNLDIKPPDPHDRPYAGWLYGGVSLLEAGDNRLENLELDLGVVGPGALGKEVQNDWHQFIGIHQARGWSSQLQNEPGLVLSYERFWRVPVWRIGGSDEVENGIDIVPQLGGSAGNVFTYGEAGALLRIGRHLEADYGPVRIRPSLSGTDYFDPSQLDHQFGYYIFAGAAGRVVAHNIFLDGNTFRQSPSVEHKTFVADLQAGLSVFWSSRARLDFSVVRRTDEFVGQTRQDIIGTAALAFSW
jgi:lipid A 3-O-deacylase